MKQTYPSVIGAFVLGAIGLIVAAILFFGSGTLFKKHYAMLGYFHGSVAGLQVGAPVNYRGVHVGEVTAIGMRIDPDTTRSIAQVNMELVPGGVDVHGAAVLGPGNPIPALVQRGLSAQLVLQSIVTGQLQVELDFRPNVQAFHLGEPFLKCPLYRAASRCSPSNWKPSTSRPRYRHFSTRRYRSTHWSPTRG